jgi:hypothetical protein
MDTIKKLEGENMTILEPYTDAEWDSIILYLCKNAAVKNEKGE